MDKDFIFIEKILRRAISDEYSTEILNSLYEDILEDIRTSADEDYNEDDVKLALGRVLIDKLNIEA